MKINICDCGTCMFMVDIVFCMLYNCKSSLWRMLENEFAMFIRRELTVPLQFSTFLESGDCIISFTFVVVGDSLYRIMLPEKDTSHIPTEHHWYVVLVLHIVSVGKIFALGISQKWISDYRIIDINQYRVWGKGPFVAYTMAIPKKYQIISLLHQ